MIVKINYILILFLVVLSSAFFAKQFKKEHVINNINAETISYLTQEIQDLNRIVSLYENKEIYLKSIIKSNEKRLETLTKANVTLTGYHPWSNGINSDGYPQTTATMTQPVVGRTCAISSELVNRGWLGKKIYIEGVGVFMAEDRMNIDLNGLRIDLCMGSLEDALNFGKKKNILAINLN
ncbi:MAG: 3D domain-containing protein [Desulfobacula sp.]|nr:3D domain-containing protein [Desulfobacula sp.]